MKQVSDTLHLIRRGDGWTYFRRVPLHLVPVLGRQFIKKSLDTSDRATAKKLRTLEDVRVDALFAEAEKGTLPKDDAGNVGLMSVSVGDIVDHVRRYVEKMDKRAADRLLADEPIIDEEDRKNRQQDVGEEIDILRNPQDIRQSEMVYAASQRIAGDAGVTVETIGTRIAEVIRRGLLEVAMRREDRYQDDFSGRHHDQLFEPRQQGKKPVVTLAVLAAQYLAKVREEHKANGVSGRTTTKSEVNVAYLLEAVGPDTPVSTIDYDTVQKLRSMIARTPSNRMKAYPKASLTEAIERAEKDGRPPMEHLTQATYTAEFKKLMQYAVDKKLLASNPAHDLKPLAKDPVPRNKKRQPLTPDQIKAFFHGGFYQSCAPGAVKPYHKPDWAWRFWLPLLMLFSGARPNELCQLFVGDVRQSENGTWYFNLANEGEDQSDKTEASKRRVPVHSELIRLGFLAFVEQRSKTVSKFGPRLFHELKPTVDNPTDYARYPGKRFNEVFLPKEIALIPRKQALYSIRHSVRDALRRAKAGDEACYAIGGWTPAGGVPVGWDYGDIHDPDHWRDEVEKIAFPGLDLSFLYPK